MTHSIEPGRVYRTAYRPNNQKPWRYTVRIDGELMHNATGYDTAREAREAQGIAVTALRQARAAAALAVAADAAQVRRHEQDAAMFDMSCEGY